MKKSFVTVLLLTALTLPAVLFAKNELQKVSITSKQVGHSSISLHFKQKTPKYHQFWLTKPKPRLVIDLFDTHLAGHALPKHIDNPLITGLRYGVLSNHKGLRLVVDLSKPANQLKLQTHPLKQKLLFNIQSQFTARNAIVVIDPGHGGKDPGASGPKGFHEKNIVLAIGKYLRADLAAMAGIHPDMTRHGDYFVTLRGRLQVARKDHADLFVAIHADSFPRKAAHGATVFALSEHGATSEAARILARSENTAVLGGADIDTKDKTVRSVLIDLSQAVTIQDSLLLGANVKQQLQHVTTLHSDRVEQAPFVVLKSPDIPSILIETGFISNLQQERDLTNPHYQQKMARAIAKGIRLYLYKHPPHHSLLELQQKGVLTYTVKKGNTLASIANTFFVSESALRKANHLSKKASVKPGQSLKIPAATF